MRLTVLLLLPLSLFAGQASLANGEAGYRANCAVCHGVNGEGNPAIQSPALAGQSAAYMQRQITYYKSGLRGAHKEDNAAKSMVAIASTIEASEAESISTYLSSASVNKALGVDGDLVRGEKYYQSYCGSCHGAKAEGNELLNSPKLTILSAPYMQRQYDHFLRGIRGVEKEDKFGRQMALIASGMKDPDIISDMIAYITHLE